MSDKMKELYVAQIKAKMAQVSQRLSVIQNPKSFDQIATHMDAILGLLSDIREFEKQYPGIMDPPTDQLIPMMEKTRDIKATIFALKIADLNIEKAKVISNDKKRANLLDEAKMTIVDAKGIVRDPEQLGKLEAKMTELKSIV